MEWGKPDMLYALAALIIPVLIHLLHLRRYKEVKFSNVSFLSEVKKEARASQRLKHLLVLLSRLIAVAALVLAFADPFITFSNKTGEHSNNIVSIYIDNSPSMEAVGENGNLLQTSKSRALKIVEQYSEIDKFHVVTNEFSGSDSRYLTREECVEKIASIKPSNIARNVDEVMSRASDNASSIDEHNKILYYLSDLQKSTHKTEGEFIPDSSLSIHFIPSFANERPNVWLDSAWFSSPIATTGKAAKLNLRIKHNALSAVEGLSMRLDVNGERKAVGTYNIEPGLSTDTALIFTFDKPAHYHAKISIDDTPIVFDNNYYLGFEVVESIKVLQITKDIYSEESKSIELVCQTNPGSILIDTKKNLPGTIELSNYDLIISNGLTSPSNGYTNSLVQFVNEGGAVLVIPDTLEFNSRAELLLSELGLGSGFSWDRIEESTSIAELNVVHPFYDGVFSSTPSKMDLPKSKYALKYGSGVHTERLGTNWNGTNFLGRSRLGKGAAFLLGTPLNDDVSNLTSHALFVPLILRMVETSRSSEIKSVVLGRENAVTLREEHNRGTDIRIVKEDSTESIIPEVRTINGVTRLMMGPALTSTGNFSVTYEGEDVLRFGVNADRVESDPKAFDIPTFTNELESSEWHNAKVLEVNEANLTTVINNIESGKHLWWYLVLVVILALTGETLLQKRWKAAS